MAKNELEYYEGMLVIEASDKKALKKKVAAIENCPAPPYAVRITKRTTEIKSNAFEDCPDVGTVLLHDEVWKIGDGAFRNCKGLTSIVIPDTLRVIGWYAFLDCANLTDVVFGKSITSINGQAFDSCVNLKSITIPKTVDNIADNAFFNCCSLQSIIVEDGNPKFDSRNGCNAIIETEKNKLMYGCKNTVIPDSVTEIGNNAFYACKELTSVVISNSVTTIGKQAFCKCQDLASIVIPDSVTTLDKYVFSDCTNLKSIKVPAKKGDFYKEYLGNNLSKNLIDFVVEQ